MLYKVEGQDRDTQDRDIGATLINTDTVLAIYEARDAKGIEVLFTSYQVKKFKADFEKVAHDLTPFSKDMIRAVCTKDEEDMILNLGAVSEVKLSPTGAPDVFNLSAIVRPNHFEKANRVIDARVHVGQIATLGL